MNDVPLLCAEYPGQPQARIVGHAIRGIERIDYGRHVGVVERRQALLGKRAAGGSRTGGLAPAARPEGERSLLPSSRMQAGERTLDMLVEYTCTSCPARRMLVM